MPSGLLWLVLSKGSCEGAIVSTDRGHGGGRAEGCGPGKKKDGAMIQRSATQSADSENAPAEKDPTIESCEMTTHTQSSTPRHPPESR